MRVSVTKDHIENGVSKHSQHCMIADAVKEARPNAQYIIVDLQTIRFSDPEKGKRFTYLTPAVAQHNLLKFDQGKTVAPFSFSLTSPVTRSMQHARRGSPDKARASHKAANRKYRKNQKKQDYAYLAANRARNHQKEREFGLRKFVE